MNGNSVMMEAFEFLTEFAGFRLIAEFLDFLTTLYEGAHNAVPIGGTFLIVIGFVLCFFGYKVVKIYCALIGLLVGVSIGSVAASFLTDTAVTYPHIITIIYVSLLGVVGAIIAFRIHLVGVFLYTFFLIFIAGIALFSIIINSGSILLLVSMAAGLIAGVLAVIFNKSWLIAITAVAGASLINGGVMIIVPNFSFPISAIFMVLLLLLGTVVQNILNSKTREEPQAELPFLTPSTSDIGTVFDDYPPHEPQAYPPDTHSASHPHQAFSDNYPAEHGVNPPQHTPRAEPRASSNKNCLVCGAAISSTSKICATCGALVNRSRL